MSRIALGQTDDIRCLKQLKEQLMFSHNYYHNIYPVIQSINLVAIGREFPILLQPVKEGSEFKTTQISPELMS